METSKIKALDKDYLVIIKPDSRLLTEEYYIKMICNNRIPMLLACEHKLIDGQDQISYEITDKVSLLEMSQTKLINGDEVYALLNAVAELLIKLEEYLLVRDYIRLDWKYIFLDKTWGKMEFMYLPQEEAEFASQFKRFCEELIEKVNHKDKKARELAYDFYKMAVEAPLEPLKIKKLINSFDERQADFDRRFEEKHKPPIEDEAIICSRDELLNKGGEEKKRDEKRKLILGVAAGAVGLFYLYKKVLIDSFGEMAAGIIVGVCLLVFVVMHIVYKKLRKRHKMSENVENVDKILITSKEIKTKEPDEKYILFSVNGGLAESIEITKFPFILGKQRGLADGIVSDEYVSRVHLEISNEGRKYYVKDMNSTNGTYLNGYRVGKNKTELIRGDHIQVGNSEYEFI